MYWEEEEEEAAMEEEEARQAAGGRGEEEQQEVSVNQEPESVLDENEISVTADPDRSRNSSRLPPLPMGADAASTYDLAVLSNYAFYNHRSIMSPLPSPVLAPVAPAFVQTRTKQQSLAMQAKLYHRAKIRGLQPEIVDRFACLYVGTRPEWYWWRGVGTLCSFFLALEMSQARNSGVQLFMASLLSISHFCLSGRLWPYAYWFDNVVSCLQHAIYTILVLFFALFSHDASQYRIGGPGLFTFGFSFFIFCIFIVMFSRSIQLQKWLVQHCNNDVLNFILGIDLAVVGYTQRRRRFDYIA